MASTAAWIEAKPSSLFKSTNAVRLALKKAPNVDRTQAAFGLPSRSLLRLYRSNGCRMAASDATGQPQAAKRRRDCAECLLVSYSR